MYLGNTLSGEDLEHPVLLSRPQLEFCHAAMEVLNLTEHFLILSKLLKQIQEATNMGSMLQALKKQIISGWPLWKSEVCTSRISALCM